MAMLRIVLINFVFFQDARSHFRQLLSESSQKIDNLAKKLGSCVERARPYYEARIRSKELQSETQKAALRFKRATGSHLAAKEMVRLAEEGLQKQDKIFDPAWQEMINHSTSRVNEAELERVTSEREHQIASRAYNDSEKLVSQLHQQLKRSIVKARLVTPFILYEKVDSILLIYNPVEPASPQYLALNMLINLTFQ